MLENRGDIIGLAYDQKVKMLEQIAQELLNIRVKFAEISGDYARMKAEIEVLRQVKSALQSAIKAEQNY